MVKDRLDEIRGVSNCPANKLRDTVIDIKANQYEIEIDSILTEYAKIRQWIQTIKENIESMKSLLREQSPTLPTPAPRTLTENMEALRSENMTLCQRVYTNMKEFEIDLPKVDDVGVVARVKRMHFYCVREEFLTVWKQHEQFLYEYEERLKRAVLRQARIADAHITEEETEALIANNSTSLFVENLLENTRIEHEKLRMLLTRQTELEKVEKSILEVRNMFVRISTLVIEQSTLICQIEYFAHQATLNIDKGAGQLEKAREKKIKRLRWKIWFLFWLTIILVVIILILLLVD